MEPFTDIYAAWKKVAAPLQVETVLLDISTAATSCFCFLNPINNTTAAPLKQRSVSYFLWGENKKHKSELVS